MEEVMDLVGKGISAKESKTIPIEEDLESLKKRITDLEEAFKLHEKMVNECIMKMY